MEKSLTIPPLVLGLSARARWHTPTRTPSSPIGTPTTRKPNPSCGASDDFDVSQESRPRHCVAGIGRSTGKRFKAGPVVFSFLCGWALVAHAEVGFGDMGLELHLDAKEYVACEPVCLVVRLLNRTGQDAWVNQALDPNLGCLSVFLGRDGEKEERISFRNEGLPHEFTVPAPPGYLGPEREMVYRRFAILDRYIRHSWHLSASRRLQEP